MLERAVCPIFKPNIVSTATHLWRPGQFSATGPYFSEAKEVELLSSENEDCSLTSNSKEQGGVGRFEEIS